VGVAVLVILHMKETSLRHGVTIVMRSEDRTVLLQLKYYKVAIDRFIVDRTQNPKNNYRKRRKCPQNPSSQKYINTLLPPHIVSSRIQ